ncbi:MAG: SgcJ/EcaC family oxidoreductase [Rhodospirillales bacterium]
MSTPRSHQLDPVSEEQAVRAAIENLADAMNRCDAAAYAACFTEDGEYTSVMGMYSQGREAIRSFHEQLFAPTQIPGLPSFRNALLTIRETRVRLLRPDVATADVHWGLLGAVGPDGRAWPERRGLLNCVLVKESGQWLVAVSHNMNLQ